MEKVPESVEWVVCPACKGRLRWGAEWVECEACGREYPVVDGIAVLEVGRARVGD